MFWLFSNLNKIEIVYKENNFLIKCLSEPRLVPLRESALNILNLLKQQLIFQFLSNNIVLVKNQDFRVFRSHQLTQYVTTNLVLSKSARVDSESDQGSRLPFWREKLSVSLFSMFNFLTFEFRITATWLLRSLKRFQRGQAWHCRLFI